VNSCEHTDMTSVNNDLQNTWSCIRRRVVLRWKKSSSVFSIELLGNIAQKFWQCIYATQFESRYINFKDNLLKESDTDGIFLRIEIIVLYMNLEE